MSLHLPLAVMLLELANTFIVQMVSYETYLQLARAKTGERLLQKDVLLINVQ